MPILEYLVGAATVASGWSGYAVKLVGQFGFRIPPELSHTTLSFAGERLTATGAYLNLPAVFVITARRMAGRRGGYLFRLQL